MLDFEIRSWNVIGIAGHVLDIANVKDVTFERRTIAFCLKVGQIREFLRIHAQGRL